MKSPGVSVIMPAYNAGSFIAEAIDSVLRQTFSDFEIIIVDDGSTDDTKKIVEDFKDERIFFLRHENNKGNVAAANAALRMARGKYVARMDADDVSEKERFMLQFRRMEEDSDLVLCGTWGYIVGDNKFKIMPHVSHLAIKIHMLFENCFIHSSVFMRRSVLAENGLMYRKLNNKGYGEDYDLFSKLIFLGKACNLDGFLVGYRRHEAQVSKSVEIYDYDPVLPIKLEYFKRMYPELTDEDAVLWSKFLTGCDGDSINDILLCLSKVFKYSRREGDDFFLAIRREVRNRLRVFFKKNKKYDLASCCCVSWRPRFLFALAYVFGFSKAVRIILMKLISLS